MFLLQPSKKIVLLMIEITQWKRDSRIKGTSLTLKTSCVCGHTQITSTEFELDKGKSRYVHFLFFVLFCFPWEWLVVFTFLQKYKYNKIKHENQFLSTLGADIDLKPSGTSCYLIFQHFYTMSLFTYSLQW